jgi:hypothetical protein
MRERGTCGTVTYQRVHATEPKNKARLFPYIYQVRLPSYFYLVHLPKFETIALHHQSPIFFELANATMKTPGAYIDPFIDRQSAQHYSPYLIPDGLPPSPSSFCMYTRPPMLQQPIPLRRDCAKLPYMGL